MLHGPAQPCPDVQSLHPGLELRQRQDRPVRSQVDVVQLIVEINRRIDIVMAFDACRDRQRIGIDEIGGARTRAEATIDSAVGLRCQARIGDEVKAGDTLGVLLCRSTSQTEHVHAKMRDAFKIRPEKSDPPKLVREIIA